MTLNRMELTKNKKFNFLGEDNRIFDLYCVRYCGHKNRNFQDKKQFFFKNILDTLVNTQTNFYRKRMRISIRILSFKKRHLILDTGYYIKIFFSILILRGQNYDFLKCPSVPNCNTAWLIRNKLIFYWYNYHVLLRGKNIGRNMMLTNRKQFQNPWRKNLYVTKNLSQILCSNLKRKKVFFKKTYVTVFFEPSINLTKVNTLELTFFDI